MPKFLLKYDFYDNPKPRIVRVEAESLYQATNKMEKVAKKIFTPEQYNDIRTCMAQEEGSQSKTPRYDPAFYRTGTEHLCNCTPVIQNGKAVHDVLCPHYEEPNPIRLEDVPF